MLANWCSIWSYILFQSLDIFLGYFLGILTWDRKQIWEGGSSGVGDKNRNFVSGHSYGLAGEISAWSAPTAISGLIPNFILISLPLLFSILGQSEWALWREQQILTGLLFLPYFMSHLDLLPCYVLPCFDPRIRPDKTFWVIILACSSTELCVSKSLIPPHPRAVFLQTLCSNLIKDLNIMVSEFCNLH